MSTTRRIPSLATLVLAIAALCAPPLGAETQWGTNVVIRTVNAWDFAPATSDVTWSIAPNLFRYSLNSGAFYAGVDVPDGALILSISLDACDNAAGSQVTGELQLSTPAGFDVLATVATGGPATPGCNRFFMDLASPATVDNDNYNYTVIATTGSTDQTTFRSIRVEYQLQVSPAPPVPTFNDVPVSDPGFQYIEALVASGITAGCGGGNYCPDATLTRRQMAVFFAKALGLNWPE